MSDESPIVSHVANQAYREHVDEMTCKAPGCKRWRVDGTTKFCPSHTQADVTTWRNHGFHGATNLCSEHIDEKDTP